MSSRTSSTALETHSQVFSPAEAPHPPPASLPSGLDIPANHDPMDLDNDPLQDSIRCVLQAAAAAHQRRTCSLYRALNETVQRTTGTEENRDPGAYIQELQQDIQTAHQQSPEGVVVQGRETKTGAWTNLAGSQRAQESDAPPPATHEESAAAVVLTLQSWTRGHTIVLHDKMPPPLRTQRNMPTDQRAHLELTSEREDDVYTLVHATRHRNRAIERKDPTPEPTATPPHRRAPDTGPYTNSWPMPAP